MSFDRAAEYYDATRGRSATGTALETTVLAAALPHGATALEIGVGTGQVAIPLHEAGVSMVGLDLSLEEVEKARVVILAQPAHIAGSWYEAKAIHDVHLAIILVIVRGSRGCQLSRYLRPSVVCGRGPSLIRRSTSSMA